MESALRHPRSDAQRIAIIIAVFIQIGATFLPAMGFGEQIGERSDAVRTLITPAGWAFSIWGPLFIGTILFAIYQFLPHQRKNALLDRIGWFAAGAFLGNGLWAVWTQFNDLNAVSAIIIAASLVCLLTILRRLVALDRPFTSGERWLIVLPLSALAAWLTAATIVNIAATLTYYGVGGGATHPALAAGIIVVGGAIAALAVARSKGNPWYAAVFLWALLAIYFQGGQRAVFVAYAAIFSGVLVGSITIARLALVENRKKWFG
ncbi:hypothetical protein [Altererythrobacter aquiaggeris]|uniref:hypothetical protein n=1 Tax=Aestuarierythrobacter aquiaggeris TaxID=1898396 RepID=UPI0030190F97